MQTLPIRSEQIRLKFTKKLFRDSWGLSLDKDPVGQLSYTMLRTKTIGLASTGTFTIKKKGRDCMEVLHNGAALATFEGKKEGKLTLSSGKTLQVTLASTLSLPGSTVLSLSPEGLAPILSAETSWNLVGVPKTEIVIEPDGLSGDDLWASIFMLCHSVVTHSLFQVPKEIGASIYVAGRALR